MREPAPIEQWGDRLEAVVADRCRLIRRVMVLRETDSTQDAARRLNACAGDVIVAWRQRAGRGRLGRPWADTHHDGVAMTIVQERTNPEHLALAVGVGVAQDAERFLNRTVEIKWPNDVLVDGRKLAGILIECSENLAYIGIGINVRQTHWPEELATNAVSLAQLGSPADRLEVICSVLPAVDHALQLADEQLVKEFIARDLLCGRVVTLRSGNGLIGGAVIALHPLRGLAVQTPDGMRWLSALTTSVVDGLELVPPAHAGFTTP